MGKLVSFLSASGGIGKTTLAALTASALAPMCGNKLLFIDCGFGVCDAGMVLGCEAETPYDLGDVLAGRCDAADAVNRCRGFLLMPPPGDGSRAQPEAAAALAQSLLGQCEYIFLDCPAVCAGEGAVLAGKSTLSIICSRADPLSLKRAAQLRRRLPREDERVRLELMRYDTAALRRGEILNIDRAIDTVCARLIGVMPECGGVSVQGGALPEQTAAARLLAERISGKEAPLMRL